jgi:hypothetical protein
MTRIRSFATATSILALAALASAPASAAPILSESFTYPAGSVTGLTGGTGFSGAYTRDGTISVPGLNYTGLATGGNKFTTASNNVGAFRTIPTINTDTAAPLYVAFLASTNGSTPNYGGISFYDGNTEELFLGKPSNTLNYGFDVSGATGGVATNGPAASTTPDLLVYRLTFTPAGETIDFFANPTPGSVLPAIPTATFLIPEATFAGDQFTQIRLQSGDQQINFDEFRTGATFADVAPVPEPSAVAALVTVAGAAVIRRRRRGQDVR